MLIYVVIGCIIGAIFKEDAIVLKPFGYVFLNLMFTIVVPKDVRKVGLPVGATMHMDGSCMALILKIVFLFGIFGKQFTEVDTYLIAILIAVLSGVVMAGIPGGRLIEGKNLLKNKLKDKKYPKGYFSITICDTS